MSARTIHPFPARMAPEIALSAIPEVTGEPLVVLDPMCGSGTVLGVALKRGHNAVGIDIDPLAVMMSTLAVTAYERDALVAGARAVMAVASKTDGEPPWGLDDETDRFVDYWFAPAQKARLIALTSAISMISDPSLRLALRLALSRIIITKTPQASLAADTSHSRPHRVLNTSDYDVAGGFGKSVAQLDRMLSTRTLEGSGAVFLGDARLLDQVEDSSADMAVTSPPYLNALDYLRGHKLALVWFGHKVSELRQRRSVSIGAERGLDAAASDAVGAIVDVIEAEAADPTVLKKPMLERYAHDCVEFAAQLARTIKPEGRAVLVVGNSTLRGNYIRNDVIAQTAMEGSGFSLVERRQREIPPSSRYMAITSRDKSSITKRMRTEVVLTLVKSS